MKQTEPRYTKEQLMSVSERPEVLSVALKDDKRYTKKQAEGLAKKLLERKV